MRRRSYSPFRTGPTGQGRLRTASVATVESRVDHNFGDGEDGIHSRTVALGQSDGDDGAGTPGRCGRPDHEFVHGIDKLFGRACGYGDLLAARCSICLRSHRVATPPVCWLARSSGYRRFAGHHSSSRPTMPSCRAMANNTDLVVAARPTAAYLVLVRPRWVFDRSQLKTIPWSPAVSSRAAARRAGPRARASRAGQG